MSTAWVHAVPTDLLLFSSFPGSRLGPPPPRPLPTEQIYFAAFDWRPSLDAPATGAHVAVPAAYQQSSEPPVVASYTYRNTDFHTRMNKNGICWDLFRSGVNKNRTKNALGVKMRPGPTYPLRSLKWGVLLALPCSCYLQLSLLFLLPLAFSLVFVTSCFILLSVTSSCLSCFCCFLSCILLPLAVALLSVTSCFHSLLVSILPINQSCPFAPAFKQSRPPGVIQHLRTTRHHH